MRKTMVTETDPIELIAPDAINYSRERILIDQLFASYNNYYNNTSPVRKSGEIFASLANLLNTETGRTVVNHLLTHEFVSVYELTELILVEDSTISRILHKLRKCGVAEKVGFVDSRALGKGAKPKIWGLVGADPMGAVQAQKRHMELKKVENGYEQKSLARKRKLEVQNRADAADAVRRFSELVIVELGEFDLDQPKTLQRIDAVQTACNVPPELSETVQNSVIMHFHRIKNNNPK